MLKSASYRDVTTSRGKPSRECTVEVAYRFYGPAGDFIEAVVPGESMDFGDKGAAKAMSVAYRIALLQALCIPTDDPEPDAQSYERAHRDEWEQAAKPPTPGQVRGQIGRWAMENGRTAPQIAEEFYAWSKGVNIAECNDIRLLGDFLGRMQRLEPGSGVGTEVKP